MISKTELERLAALRSDEGIVSVYIGIEPRLRYDRGQHEVKFRGATKRFERTADEHARAVLERETGAILDLLGETEPAGRGLAAFVSSPAGIRELVHLDVRVPTWIDAGASTNVGLLAQVVNEYPRWVVAVVQRDQATLYYSEQGHAEEAGGIESSVPGKHDQGGWAQARFQRHIEVHVERHLEKVDALQELQRERPFSHLVLAGTGAPVTELREMLPGPLQSLVIGSVPVDFKHASEDEILEQARAVLVDEQRRVERELVEQVVDAAESGGQGAAGFDDTLAALHEGRVQTLLVAEGITEEGSSCLDCDYLATSRFERCPRCGGEAEASTDVVERAIDRALLSGARVEVVLGEAREWLLARGGIGAVLRY
ncbi:MAG: Vms1/Ankzf1 family peptidyl-tRNA hydrolase [Dehalococcoidia bacterium]